MYYIVVGVPIWILNHSQWKLVSDYYNNIAKLISNDPEFSKALLEMNEFYKDAVESTGQYNIYQNLKRRPKSQSTVFNLTFCGTSTEKPDKVLKYRFKIIC